MKIIYIAIVIVLFSACNGETGKNMSNIPSDELSTTSDDEIAVDTFTKVKFNNKAEELIYIRKYIEYRLPKVLIEEEPQKMEEALEELIGDGQNVTLEEAVKYTWMYNGAYKRLWYMVTERKLSFKNVKAMLYSYKTLYPRGQQKIKEEDRMLPLKVDNDEIELPPVAGYYNPDEEKIYGDFDGNGNYEYAYRVLIEKGKGNPVEDGTPDVYQIQFSDKDILAVNVGCCSFKLILEGDLNNDGSDEFSIAQAPMNGCIGEVKTFTVKSKRVKLLFEPFVFFNCNNLKEKDYRNFVFTENGYIYYNEIDPNGDGLLKQRAEIIR